MQLQVHNGHALARGVFPSYHPCGHAPARVTFIAVTLIVYYISVCLLWVYLPWVYLLRRTRRRCWARCTHRWRSAGNRCSVAPHDQSALQQPPTTTIIIVVVVALACSQPPTARQPPTLQTPTRFCSGPQYSVGACMYAQRRLRCLCRRDPCSVAFDPCSDPL